MEGKDVAGSRLWVEAIGEVGFDAGRFVQKRQGASPSGQRIGEPFRIARGLDLDASERRALSLRLDDPACLAVYVQQIVG